MIHKLYRRNYTSIDYTGDLTKELDKFSKFKPTELHYLKETYIQKINDSTLSIRVPGCITVGNIYLDSNIITAIELDISTGIYSSKCLDYIKQIIGDEIVLI